MRWKKFCALGENGEWTWAYFGDFRLKPKKIFILNPKEHGMAKNSSHITVPSIHTSNHPKQSAAYCYKYLDLLKKAAVSLE
jgi:hypothetical protein